jgi:diguanylate cyclase (GGDEF)-like protein
MQLGDVMRRLERHDEARAYLQESLLLMGEQNGSRNFGQVLGNMAQLALDMGDPTAALASFMQLEEHVKLHQEPDAVIKAWRGQASALARLGRPQEAHLKAQAALNLARENGNAHFEIEVLSVLADLHARNPLPTPPDLFTASASLHYLNLALKAAGLSGYAVSGELLNQIAAAQAAAGDFRLAYENLLAADAARSKTRGLEAQKRALAMQVRNEIEQARAETELHRQRASVLRETTSTLETLGNIGREITASLDSGAVFAALHRHVYQLLDATFFAVYLIDAEQRNLVTAYGMEAGAPLPARSLGLDNPTSKFVRCALTRQEIVLNLEPMAPDPNLIPGTLATLSLLYAPMQVGDRLLGVMSIQSPKPLAYGEREQSIYRALCAYGAIALDNAAAYGAAEAAQRRADDALQELRQTQVELVQKNSLLERLAATDQLTGLNNRLRLTQALEEEVSRSRRYASSFCLLLLDVDHFKSVNDNFGHPVGDQVLMGIAAVLLEGIREVDIAGRWGGEEFLIICRETSLQGALVLAEKLRSSIQARCFEPVGNRTASLGVALYRPGEAMSETMARADKALYRAKEGGRNRVACLETEPGTSLPE